MRKICIKVFCNFLKVISALYASELCDNVSLQAGYVVMSECVKQVKVIPSFVLVFLVLLMRFKRNLEMDALLPLTCISSVVIVISY